MYSKGILYVILIVVGMQIKEYDAKLVGKKDGVGKKN